MNFILKYLNIHLFSIINNDINKYIYSIISYSRCIRFDGCILLDEAFIQVLPTSQNSIHLRNLTLLLLASVLCAICEPSLQSGLIYHIRYGGSRLLLTLKSYSIITLFSFSWVLSPLNNFL